MPGRSRAQAATMGHAIADVREAVFQRSALALLKQHPKVVWVSRINAGQRGTVKLAIAGIPDLIGQLSDGRFLGVECKAKNGKLRESQAAFIERATRHGAAVGVAYTIEDVLAIVDG